ncbi:MAG: hypothetical protein NTX52_05290 [Planctomycetota bacterium]|nr:hypothetical protein [Planctomycetota bacterium]
MEITRTELIEAIINTLRDYDVDGDAVEIATGVADSLMIPEDDDEEPYGENFELDEEDDNDEDDDY